MVRFTRQLQWCFMTLALSVAVLCLAQIFFVLISPTPPHLDHNLTVAMPVSRGFLVQTPACSIPDLDPWDSAVAPFVRQTGQMFCQGRRSVTYVDGTILRINRTHTENHLRGDFSHCRYQAISRPTVADSDSVFFYSDLGDEVATDVEMRDEFVRIYCYSHSEGILSTTFHAFVLPKEEVERRCQLKLRKHLRQNAPREVLNVVMLGVDSVSRMNMIRQMPRTRDFLLNQLQAVEMTGYNKVADNTFVNIVPMTVGKFVEEVPWNETLADQPFDNFTFIWKNFSEAGYRTLYAEDFPEIAIFNYLKKGFHRAPADYYNRPLALAMEKHPSVWNHRHHCVANMLETTMLLNYLTDFSRLFSHPTRSSNEDQQHISSKQGSNPTPYFGFTFITRLTHDDVNSAGAADEPYVNFLRRFRDEGRFNNTVLIFFSDHGYRFGELRNTYVGKLEERLPFLFVVVPPWFGSRYPRLRDNLQSNAKRLTTPFDVFETLKDILYFDGQERPAGISQKGISLFRRIPQLRSCEHAHILPHWCTCLQRRQLSVNEEVVQKAAAFLVHTINQLLAEHLHLCSRLNLESVLGAEKMSAIDDVLRFKESVSDVINRTVRFGDKSKSDEIYQLTLRTEPGGALFESTLHYGKDHKFALGGDISRINVYGTQAECLNNFFLKKFCFCKKELKER